jgi:hypothetical protein
VRVPAESLEKKGCWLSCSFEILLQIEASHIRLHHACDIIVPFFYWGPSLGLQTARLQHGLLSFLDFNLGSEAAYPGRKLSMKFHFDQNYSHTGMSLDNSFGSIPV